MAKVVNLNDVYNLLYMARDGAEEGPAYELARDLYSSLRAFPESLDSV
jgi:hypothetical protein